MLDQCLKDKVILLTAATSGIGLATAELSAQAGALAIYVNGRNPQAGSKAVARVREKAKPGAVVEFLPGDLTDPEQVAQICSKVLVSQGRIDVFVHAGGAEISPNLFVDLDPSTYRPLIDGHFTSLLYCCKHIAPMMIQHSSGSIVVIASDAGKVATPGESLIGAMKAATIMYARTLALELSRHNVRVNVITPSLVLNTKAHDRVMASDFSRKIFEKASKRARLGVPSPIDIAPLAVFLASSLASHLTGQAISVNGGISAA